LVSQRGVMCMAIETAKSLSTATTTTSTTSITTNDHEDNNKNNNTTIASLLVRTTAKTIKWTGQQRQQRQA